jgi:hypothetical protein
MPEKMGAAKLVPPATVSKPEDEESRKPLVQLPTWPVLQLLESLVQYRYPGYPPEA